MSIDCKRKFFDLDTKSTKSNLISTIGFSEVIIKYLLSCSTILKSENNIFSLTFFVKSSKWLGNLFWKTGDEKIIDGIINYISLTFIPNLTKFVGKLQTGLIYHYAFAIFIGLVSILTYFLVSIGG